MPPDQTTVPALSPGSPYPVMQRINPSPDVQQQVASAIQACTKWQPQAVLIGTADAPPAPLSTEAQVCNMLDRWPLLHDEQELQAASVGVGLAIATAVACVAVWGVFRCVLATLPLSLFTSQVVDRLARGGLCGVGFTTLALLLSLDKFAAIPPDEIADKVFRLWQGTASWTAAVFAVLFVLPMVPGVWQRWRSRAAIR